MLVACCVKASGNTTALLVLFIVKTSLMVFIAVNFLITIMNMSEDSSQVLETLGQFAKVNGCSDEVTVVDVTQHQEDIDAANSVVKEQCIPML